MSARFEKQRGFQPPWYYLIVLGCDCGEVRCRVSWKGRTPPGAIYCASGKHTIDFHGTVREVAPRESAPVVAK